MWAEQAVVNDFGPHDMRRTCISNLLDSGADVVTVADLVVIPCWASPHDLRSVGVVVDLCKKGGKPYVMVLNAVTAARRRP